MAPSNVQKECELWIVNEWLPKQYDCIFSETKLVMQERGEFKFDAVNKENSIVGNISTSSARTHDGASASGPKSKLRADCLMLALVSSPKKLMLLTELCMYNFAVKEQKEGRLPLDIELLHIELPEELKTKLIHARDLASKENRQSV